MKIKTRLQISVAVIAVLFVLVGLVTIVVSKRLTEGNKLAKQANIIEHEVILLNLLIHDYLLHPAKRSIDQFYLTYQKLGVHLEETRFNQVEEKVLVRDMRSNYEQLAAIYAGLISVQQKWEEEITPKQNAALRQQDKRLSEQLLVKSQIMISASFRLHDSTELSSEKTLQKMFLYLSILFVILFVFFLFISFWVYLTVIPPITQLKKGIDVLGTGNFGYKVATNAKDEIGDLSRSFDSMTENLATITVSRDELSKEIETRKQIEKQLKLFKITLDQTMDCVFMFAPDTLKFFYVNEGAVSQVGYKENQFYDMTPLDIKPEFTEETFREMISPLVDGRKKTLLFETVHKHMNGTLIPVEIFLQFMKQPTEGKGRFLAIVRDITKRKIAYQSLQTVMDAVDAMIYVADIDTCEILFKNRYVKTHFGYIEGKKCWEAIQAGQNGPCHFCEFHNLDANNKLSTDTHVWQVQNLRNGEWYECRDENIQWVDGRTVRIQVATEISERKKSEQEREKLIEELQAAISEIKSLRGILPICSFCKNIRNDEGYYEQIEGYIHKHSGVDFSHTICPTCMKEHYPEEHESIMKKKRE